MFRNIWHRWFRFLPIQDIMVCILKHFCLQRLMQKFWALERTIVKHRSSSRVYLLEKEELIINREIIKPKVEGSIFRIDKIK